MTSRRTLTTLFLIVFTDLVGFGIVIPLLPLYAEHFQPAGWVLGLLMASFSAMQFVFAPVLGRLSDRVGRRPVLLLSLAGSLAGYVLFAVAGSMAMLFVSRLLAGICGANIATAQAVIADTTPPEGRAKGMGLIGAAFGLGFIAGPALAGLLLQLGTSAPGWGAAACSAAALVMAIAFLPETRSAATEPAAARFASPFARLARGWSDRRLAPLLLLGFLVVTGFAGFEVGGGYWQDDNGLRGDNKSRAWGGGVTYGVGPFVVGASYLNAEREQPGLDDDKLQRVLVGGRYTYGPGMDLRASVQWYGLEADRARPSADGDSWAFVLGTTVSF